MNKKLLYFVRSLFLNFDISSKKALTPSVSILCLGMFFMYSINYAQCSFGGTQFSTTQSIIYNKEAVTGTNIGTVTFTGVPVGRFVAVNVIQGLTYTISASSNQSFRKRITLFNSANTGTSVGTADATATNTVASINWSASFTGVLFVRINNSTNCNSTTGNNSTITVTYTGGNNTADLPNATAEGNNSWIAHVYDFSDTVAIDPLTDANAFTNSSYLGYFAQANIVTGTTTSFAQGYGGALTPTVAFTAAGTSQNFYGETFAVRYRMRSTLPAGCYFVKVRGDDGVRLSIDGVKVFDAWVQQGPTEYSNVLVYLNGNSQLVLDYYDFDEANVTDFTITPASTTINTLNTITPTGPITRCNGSATTALTGSTVATQGNNSIAPVLYQWQFSNDNVAWNDISGATGKDYTVPGTSPTVATQIYYRRNVKGSTINSATACIYSSNAVAIVTSPTTALTVPSTTSATNVSCSSFTANWTTVASAMSYRLDVSTSPIFAAGAFVINDLNVGFTTSYSVTVPTAGIYYYRVRAYNSCATTTLSGYSNTQTVNAASPTATISGATTVCLNASAPSVTFTNPRSSAITITYNINSGSSTTINVPANANATVIASTAVSGSFVYNLENVVYQSSPPCSTILSGSVTITITPNTSITSVTGASPVCIGGTSTAYTATGVVLGSGTGAWSSSNTIVATVDASGNVTALSAGTSDIMYTITGGCSGTKSASKTITVNANASVTSVTGANSICIGGATTSYTATGVVLGGGTGAWSSTSPLIASVDASGNVTGLAVGTTNIVYTITGGCTGTKSAQKLITVGTLPTIPTITITQPTCTVLTGTITVTSPAPGTGFTYSIDGIDYTNTTGIFTVNQNTTYNVTTQNASECISPARSAVINASSDRVWNGSIDKDWTNPANWTPNIVPTSTDCVVIPLTAKKPEIAAGTSVAIHSVTIDNAAILTVKSKAILTVATGITVATGGDLIFEDDSSLLQTSTDNTINSGNITYKRITSDVRRYDFTCWSSPIHSTPAFTLHDVSPLTLADKYYSFNPSTGWIISYGGVLPMQQGMGYIVRAPQTYDITTPAPYEASFIGTPNNGRIEITPEANKNILVGNPYPSALNAKAFIDDNHDRGVDVGSLYFWTHNSPPVNSIPGDKKYYYNTADYAVYNLTGSTTGSSTPGNNDTPTGFIAAAASFFIKPNSSTNIVFTNSMRVGAGNDQFYKTAKADNEGKNRLWLNFANTEGAFKQVLIGYLDGATNEKDYNYDGPTISGNAYVDFYSINNTDKLTIQGRALPFDDSDLVPLGYVSKIVGDFTISIDKADGFFDTQAVYLEDKNTGKITDLRAENYTFATEKGTFQDRFVLRYTNKTLGTGDFENIENGLLVAVKDKAIKITSAKEAIKEVTIFDINGKLLYDKKKIGSTELQIANLQAANQVLLVKVILENGFTTTKKIVFQ